MLGHKHGDGNITATFIIFNGNIMLSEEENDVCRMHLQFGEDTGVDFRLFRILNPLRFWS